MYRIAIVLTRLQFNMWMPLGSFRDGNPQNDCIHRVWPMPRRHRDFIFSGPHQLCWMCDFFGSRIHTRAFFVLHNCDHHANNNVYLFSANICLCHYALKIRNFFCKKNFWRKKFITVHFHKNWFTIFRLDTNFWIPGQKTSFVEGIFLCFCNPIGFIATKGCW